MDLEKAYEKIDRDGLWTALRLYGLGGRLLKRVQSFYVNSRACVRVENGVSDWFPVQVGLQQGCMMSPLLFYIYTDGGRGMSVEQGRMLVHDRNEWRAVVNT